MQKELFICIIIIISIVVGNILTHNNTKSAIAEVNTNLQEVSNKIWQKENDNEIQDAISTSKEIWDDKYKVLAYYIEHVELEKVSEALVKAKSNISAEEYNTAIENIDSCTFLLQHIEEKDKFSLKNIF